MDDEATITVEEDDLVCPFCAEGQLMAMSDEARHWVMCLLCFACGPCGEDDTEALSLWTNRTSRDELNLKYGGSARKVPLLS